MRCLAQIFRKAKLIVLLLLIFCLQLTSQTTIWNRTYTHHSNQDNPPSTILEVSDGYICETTLDGSAYHEMQKFDFQGNLDLGKKYELNDTLVPWSAWPVAERVGTDEVLYMRVVFTDDKENETQIVSNMNLFDDKLKLKVSRHYKYKTSSDTRLYEAEVIAPNRIVATGYAKVIDSIVSWGSYYRPILVCFDFDLNIVWEKTYVKQDFNIDPYYEMGSIRKLLATGNGEFLSIVDYGYYDTFGLVAKLDSNGNVIWTNLNIAINPYMTDINTAADSGYHVLTYRLYDQFTFWVYHTRIFENGTSDTSRWLFEGYYPYVGSVQRDNRNGFIVTAKRDSNRLERFDGYGNLDWRATYMHQDHHFRSGRLERSLATSDSGYVISGHFNRNIKWILKLDKDGNLSDPGSATNLSFVNHSSDVNLSIYPNPASAYVQAHYPAGFIRKMRLYNLQGALVSEVTGARMSLNNLAPGQYILQVHTDGRVENRKLIKL